MFLFEILNARTTCGLERVVAIAFPNPYAIDVFSNEKQKVN